MAKCMNTDTDKMQRVLESGITIIIYYVDLAKRQRGLPFLTQERNMCKWR